MFAQTLPTSNQTQPQHLHSLTNPLFARDRPLWLKTQTNHSSSFFKKLKKYQFTKLGKTFGFQTTRFLALSESTLYYFQYQQSYEPLGSCDIKNVYCSWSKVDQNRFKLLLNNGCESTVYFFRTDNFINQNRKELAKFTVQLGFFQKYNIIEELGEGSFASVYRATDKHTHQQFSAKVFTRTTCLNAILREIDILRQIVGLPNVCQYYGLFQTQTEIIILTKFVPGKDLRTIIHYSGGLQEEEIKKILVGICNGLNECHRQNIIHRDIKPQNIIIDLDTMQPTIIDFGLSLDAKQPHHLNRCGTAAYMAPQVYQFPQTTVPYNSKCDIFSLGILSHLLMLGNNPLKDDKQTMVNRKIPFIWNQVQAKNVWGQEGHQFLQKTLSVCINNRWDINDVLFSPFLGLNSQKTLRKVQSCSTLEDRHFQYDI